MIGIRTICTQLKLNFRNMLWTGPNTTNGLRLCPLITGIVAILTAVTSPRADSILFDVHPLLSVTIDSFEKVLRFGENLRQYFERWPNHHREELDLQHRNTSLLPVHHGVRPQAHLLFQVTLGKELGVYEMLEERYAKDYILICSWILS